ncbi:MAG: hypothetical protein Q9225_003562 [Loekoesia sp. 1 TL-2023]
MSGTFSDLYENAAARSNAANRSKSMAAFATKLGTQENDPFSQNPPLGLIANDFHPDDLKLLGLSDTFSGSNAFTEISGGWSGTVSGEDLTPSNHNSGEYSFETADRSSSFSSNNSSASSPEKLPQDIGGCTEEAGSCWKAALKILQALHAMPSICFSARTEQLDPTNTKPRTTESMLTTNREAVRLVSGMLECHCFANFQMQLIHATICYKLVVWYRAMLKDNDRSSNRSSQGEGISDKRMTEHKDECERILHQPITVGGYAIDVKLQPKIRAQVISGELRHLEALVCQFSGCLEKVPAAAITGQKDKPGSARADLSRTSAGIKGCLLNFFDEQVQAAKADIDGILSSGAE